jgi:hypothetical protein
MWFSSWLANRNPSQAGTCGRAPGALRKRPIFRPRLETLEDRWLPTTWTVMTTADSGPGSLRADIAVAKAGDTIDLSGLSGQTISLTSGRASSDGELVLNKNLTIQGPSATQAPVTISGGNFSRVFEIDGTSTQVAMSNLNLTGGIGVAGNATGNGAQNGQGGAIWNDGLLTLTACNLSSNQSASQGGALWNGGTLTLNACNLSSNSCYDGSAGLVPLGGAIYNVGKLTISSSTLSGNSAGGFPSNTLNSPEPGDGGAIYNAGTLTVNNSILSNNLAYLVGSGGYGGGIFNAYNASATVTGSSLTGNGANGAQNDGGGIYNDGTMTLSGSTISGNAINEGRGGGIFNDQKGHLTIQSKSSIVNNYPYDLYNLGRVSISKDSSVGTILK